VFSGKQGLETDTIIAHSSAASAPRMKELANKIRKHHKLA